MSPVVETTPEASANGALYIVGLPIGHPDDLSVRALRVLREVELVAAEDTRVTDRLFAYHRIETPITAYRQHSGGAQAGALADRIERGAHVALVSDAGMPGIADPGHELIGLCARRGLPIRSVPGPVAAITALAASGLPSQRFAFDGFPPRPRSSRIAFFERLRQEPRTVLLYESPRRFKQTLADLHSALGPDRRIAVAWDLTRPRERWLRGSLGEVAARCRESAPRGEIALVVEGRLSTIGEE